MKSYGQFIDKSIALDESIVGRYFDSSRFGPGGNKNVTTGLKPNVPTVRQQQKTKPNNPTKPPLRATSQRPPAGSNAPDLLKNRNPVRAARKVVDAAKKKNTPELRSKIAQFASNNKVREVGSFLNQARKNLPTAADFAPTSQAGFGLGGTLKGRSLKPFSAGVKNRKKFEPSTTVRRTGLGGDKPREVTFRGREIDPRTGETIEKDRNPTSYRGKVANRIKRGLGIVDIRDKDTKSDEPKGKDKVTKGDEPKNPPKGSGGSKVTGNVDGGKKPPGGAEASVETPKPDKRAATGTSAGIKFPRNIKKVIKPDTTVRNQEVKTDPSKLNPVKGYKQDTLPGMESKDKPKTKTEKKPRKQRTPEEIAASSKKRAETIAANKKKKAEESGQGTIPGLEDRNQSRTDAVDKAGVKTKGGKTITGDTQPKITGTKKDKITSSDNVDKTSKPVEKPVEKPKSNEVVITDTREKEKPAGKKRGPKKGSTNVRTLARQNREKKQQETQAKERLASAVKKQEEQDKKNPIEQAKQDSKTSTALTGSTLERNRKELAKMLNLGSGSASGKKKNTQLKDMSDDELARQEQDSDTGKYRRNATSTNKKKKINPNASKSTGKKNVKKTFTNKKKDEKTKTESFSHWREEFIWETDKKYPEKVKEIKPMTGKNTITINPEDETSKYKRGYQRIMITNIKGTQAACGTDAAGASTFGSATVVRLVNNGGTARLVSVIDSVGGSTTIGTFTMPGNTVEFVEKKSTEAIFAADATVLGAAAAYSIAQLSNQQKRSIIQGSKLNIFKSLWGLWI